MVYNKKFILLFASITLLLVACSSNKVNTDNESTTSMNEVATIKIEEEMLLYEEFGDLKSVYDYEPFYTADEWMNDENELLFPYENNRDKMSGIENILASLYMPDEVLEKASTNELLRVVCEGWLSTYATSASLFNLPSQYVANSMARNQASNELIRRSDMVNVLIEDYSQKCYAEGNEYSDTAAFIVNQIQFEEIILASNHAYAQMDDNMKQKVINAVLEKVACIESEQYYTGDLVSGFFTYIMEEQTNGGSYWYTYICENEIDTALKYLDLEKGVIWQQMK